MSLDQLGSRRAIADLFVMFIAGVKKLQKFVNVLVYSVSKLAIVLI